MDHASALLQNPFLAAIGTLFLLSKLFSVVKLLADLFVLPGISIAKLGKKGTWAVITGASDGIGKEYAIQLAKKGYNILLVSRTQSKLDALAGEIEQASHVETKTLAMDFAADKEADYVKMKQMVDQLDVSVLVNNVGQSHSIPVPFAETEEKEMRDIITINCMGTLKVTKLIAPGMIKRRRGLILTMASFGGVFPTPLLATYSGSKAFLQQWSSALASELAPHEVRVQLVQSYLVTSAMSKIRKSSLMVPNPRQFVRAALSKIGRQGGSQGITWTSTPYWSHAMYQWAIVNLTPGPMNGWVINVNRKMHENIRKKALRKAAREAKKSS